MRAAMASIAMAAVCGPLTLTALAQTTGVLELYDAASDAPADVAFPPETTGAHLRVIDPDLINPSDADSIFVIVSAPPDIERVVLRAAAGSAAFNGDLGFNIGAVPREGDGRLQVGRGAVMEATYSDPQDDFGNLRQVSASAIVGAVTGAVSGRWTRDLSPYFVLGTTSVAEGLTLTIDPGVRVRYLENAALVVAGSLKVNGTAADSVFMEATECYSAYRDWPTLDLRSSTTRLQYVVLDCGYGIKTSGALVMENCAVRHQAGAGLSGSGMLTVTNTTFEANEHGVLAEGLLMTRCNVHNNRSHGVSLSSGTITDTFIQNNGGWGLGARGGRVTNCVLTGNGRGGVITCGGDVVFQHNDLFDNGPSSDFRNDCYAEVNAWYNFWGAATTAEMNAGSNPKNIGRIDDVYDEPRRAFVNYAHWVDSPVRTGIASRTWGGVKSLYR